MAPELGLEPRTYWLTANRSTIELLRNSEGQNLAKGPKPRQQISLINLHYHCLKRDPVALGLSSARPSGIPVWCSLTLKPPAKF